MTSFNDASLIILTPLHYAGFILGEKYTVYSTDKNLKISFILDLTKVCFEYNCFEFQGIFYIHIKNDETGMESPFPYS